MITTFILMIYLIFQFLGICAIIIYDGHSITISLKEKIAALLFNTFFIISFGIMYIKQSIVGDYQNIINYILLFIIADLILGSAIQIYDYMKEAYTWSNKRRAYNITCSLITVTGILFIYL